MPRYERNRNVSFINPYTFVPTPKGQLVKRSAFLSENCGELHTGILRCRLYVRTPLGIPDTEQGKPEVDKHQEYPFFSYQEEGKCIPVIPGSSLRGMVRSVFEAGTDSCFSTLREDTGLSKRVENYKAYKPGILKWENGTWHLYQAERYLLAVNPVSQEEGCSVNYTKYDGLPADVYVNVFEKEKDGIRFARTAQGEELRFGDEVEFAAYTAGNALYKKNGYLVWNGVARNIRKKAAGIPGQSGGMKQTDALGQTVVLKQTGVSGQSGAVRQSGTLAQAGKRSGLVYVGETFGRKKHGESIFVPGKEVKELAGETLKKAYEGLLETLEIYRNPAINRCKGHSGYEDFEHAQRERGIPLWYSEKDSKLSLASIGRTFYNTSLNELAGVRNPCVNREELCEACALFGMAGEESLGSRIRFTDGKVQGSYGLEWATLKILGQPRYSYLPFYAKSVSGILAVPHSYDEDHIEIAGRKFYWHNPKAVVDKSIYNGGKKNKMNSTMQLVKPGAEFCFSIYYDGITQEQLEKLMWCIHFGENKEDGDLCHKLGHGKPLGLGSVKIVIEKNEERIFKGGSYQWQVHTLPEQSVEPVLRNGRALKKVMSFRGMDGGVSIKYPYICDEYGNDLSETGRNEDARHVWYQKNKEAERDQKDAVELLPNILAKNQALHPYQKIQGNSNQNHYGTKSSKKRI